MAQFIVREFENEVLISLPSLIKRLPIPNRALWVFRDVQLNGGPEKPFGFRVPEFERLTREQPNGFTASQESFDRFLKMDLQFLDGSIDVLADYPPNELLLRIDCEDSSQWELSSHSEDLTRKLDEAGFIRV
jgi:hypothetical protein